MRAMRRRETLERTHPSNDPENEPHPALLLRQGCVASAAGRAGRCKQTQRRDALERDDHLSTILEAVSDEIEKRARGEGETHLVERVVHQHADGCRRAQSESELNARENSAFRRMSKRRKLDHVSKGVDSP